MRSFKRKRQALDTLQTMILLVVGIFIALPIYLTVINTFKPSNDIIGDPLGLPIPPVMDNIVVIIENPYANIVKMYFFYYSYFCYGGLLSGTEKGQTWGVYEDLFPGRDHGSICYCIFTAVHPAEKSRNPA